MRSGSRRRSIFSDGRRRHRPDRLHGRVLSPETHPARGSLGGLFRAMGGPCEVLIEPVGAAEARALVRIAAREALRIERKFSRYRGAISWPASTPERPIDRGGRRERPASRLRSGMSHAERRSVRRHLRRSSTGLDLRRQRPYPLARFRAGAPSPHRLAQDPLGAAAPHGAAGMEIDLGGIAKEYAVDRASDLLATRTPAGTLVNFAGDLRARRRSDERPWRVGIEDRRRPTRRRVSSRSTRARSRRAATAAATSRRTASGTRTSGSRTGWPVAGAPRSVTVLAESCTEAGMLATLALLRGAQAEAFLDEIGRTLLVHPVIPAPPTAAADRPDVRLSFLTRTVNAFT